MIEKITEYVDDFLAARARSMNVAKKQLSIFMCVRGRTLLNSMYCQREEGRKFEAFVTIREVVGPIAGIFSGKIESSIINGFQSYAQENKLIAEHLKLGLYYNNEGTLCYQAYYENKAVNVDLIEYFKAKK